MAVYKFYYSTNEITSLEEIYTSNSNIKKFIRIKPFYIKINGTKTKKETETETKHAR